MAAYPTYTVAGVDCNDPSGRWELLPSTDVLPSFPGRRVSKWTVPGMVGDQTAGYAPGEAMTVSITMRFNAVGTVAGRIVSGGVAAKTKAISDNIDMFFHRTRLAAQGYLGMVDVRRYKASNSYRRFVGRVISATKPEWPEYADYATMTILFEAPAGVWTNGPYVVTKATIKKAKTSTRIKVPAGTAPTGEVLIAIKGPRTSAYGDRITFTNGHGTGFKLGASGAPVVIPSGQWLVVNCLTWRYGLTPHKTDGKIWWGCEKPNTGLIEPKGRPMGTAITVIPEREEGVGWVYAWCPSADTQVMIRNRKAWY